MLISFYFRVLAARSFAKKIHMISSRPLLCALALAALLSLAGFNLNKEKKIRGWSVSTEAYDRKKIGELKQQIADSTFKSITSVIVIKNGKLLIEEYFNGAGRDTLHDTRSVGKTFASAITGIAISEGHLKNVNQRLGEFYDLRAYDNYLPQKDSVTIRNLLTMSSGFDGDDGNELSPGNEENMYPQPDWVSWTLKLPMAAGRKPGESWAYFTAGVVVLGDILNKSVPGGLEEYAGQKLFTPLGITKYQWQYTPQHVPNTAGGLRMSALDLAKFGQLYKSNGKWNGRQVIPESWVKESHSRHYAIPGDDMHYGYLWWNKVYKVNDKPYEIYACSGNGGNKIFVFTTEPLVVVITSTAYNKPYAHSQANKIIENYILPAVL
jgi:CubicO group peptidase (beta-lactamase class C family)